MASSDSWSTESDMDKASPPYTEAASSIYGQYTATAPRTPERTKTRPSSEVDPIEYATYGTLKVMGTSPKTSDTKSGSCQFPILE